MALLFREDERGATPIGTEFASTNGGRPE